MLLYLLLLGAHSYFVELLLVGVHLLLCFEILVEVNDLSLVLVDDPLVVF